MCRYQAGYHGFRKAKELLLGRRLSVFRDATIYMKLLTRNTSRSLSHGNQVVAELVRALAGRSNLSPRQYVRLVVFFRQGLVESKERCAGMLLHVVWQMQC